jgi:hypothetical protein
VVLPGELVTSLGRRERATGPGITDSADYRVWHAVTGNAQGVPQGKYLVREDGTLAWFVDPSINGLLTKHDDGTPAGKFDAPKTRLMALIIDGILNQKLPWGLVLIGAFIAIVMQLAGVPALPFAVGVYLPLSASVPVFLGGMVRALADHFTKRTADEGDSSPGVLLSSGYIAGGSVAAILIIFLSLIPGFNGLVDFGARLSEGWNSSNLPALVSIVVLMIPLLISGLQASGKSAPGERRSAD